MLAVRRELENMRGYSPHTCYTDGCALLAFSEFGQSESLCCSCTPVVAELRRSLFLVEGFEHFKLHMGTGPTQNDTRINGAECCKADQASELFC